MSKQSLIIYNLPVLFNILNEIKENFNFTLHNFSTEQKLEEINKENFGNFLILTNTENQIENNSNQIVIDKFPVEVKSIIEKVNISLLRQNYSLQSEVLIKEYKLNINSREISKLNKNLKLTEREIEIILFLYNSKDSKSIENLQKEVWGHNSNLETHTVETHIYRLRKKISDKYKDENFIISTENGYKI